MNEEWIENLSVGDDVIVCIVIGNLKEASIQIVQVVNDNAITVAGMEYDRYEAWGKTAMLPNAPTKWIEEVTNEKLAIIQKTALIESISNANFNILPAGTLHKISSLIEPMPDSPPRIVCAALMLDNCIICGVRHFDSIMIDQINRTKNYDDWGSALEGFVDTNGKFMEREESLKVAIINNQIIAQILNMPLNELFSENLY